MPAQPRSESMRPAWKGFLRFSLVSIAVSAINAKRTGQKIELNWLHEKCLSRIKYQKVCPIHGEVREDEIISGYHLGKNHYLPLEKQELAALRTQKEDSINVDVMIDEDQLDPLYLSDSSYYLVPEGKAAEKPYRVFQEALHKSKCYGIAQVVLFKKQQLVVVRSMDDLLTMTSLHYASEMRLPADIPHSHEGSKPSAREYELAHHLIQASIDKKFEFASYTDTYSEKLQELIDAKSKGKKFQVRESDTHPVGIDFADALKKSLAKATKRVALKPRGKSYHKKVS